jgi:sugar phosphate isomerase/epimerase
MVTIKCSNIFNARINITKVFILMLLFLAVIFSGCLEEQKGFSEKYDFSPSIGVCTSMENSHKLKAIGYTYIEESVGRLLMPQASEEKFEKKYAEFRKSALPVEACNSFIPGSLKSVGPDAVHDEVLAYAETAFRRAERIGVKRIVFGSGGSRGIPKGFDRTKAKEQFVELLKKMGPIAGKYDVIVCIEPLNSKECNFINSVGEGAQIAKLVNHPNIKLLADMYHMARENEPPSAIVKAGPLLYHCHIAENENRWFPGKNREDLTGYLAALKQIGYDGRISIECKWDKFEEELPVAFAYMNEQVEKVNQLLINKNISR